MDQKELFANYEFSNSNWNKFIYKLLGASLIFHVIILLFLIFVPAVRDTFYIALLFSDAPTTWVNKDYNKTVIEKGETASVISLPPSDQLQYPAGYFNLANGDAPAPDLIASTTNPVPPVTNAVPGFEGFTFDQPIPAPTPFPTPTNYNPTLAPIGKQTASILPKPPRIKKGAKLTPFEEANSPNKGSVAGIPNSSPTPTPKTEPKSDETAKVSPSPTPDPTKPNELDQKPLQDLAARAIKQINDKEIDLTKPVNVTVKGVLDSKGKLIPKQTKYTNNGGDEKLAMMTAELISAMNDSNMLTYVQSLCGDRKQCDVNFNVSKDEKDVKFQVVSVAGDEAKAKSIASGLNMGFSIFRSAKTGTEEGELLNGITVTSDKGQVIINWQMDAPTAMKKIQIKLDKIAAEQLTKPTSLTSANSNAQAAVK